MKSKISVHDRATLACEIATLAEATPEDLKSRWRVLYGTEPPPRISRDLLTRAVAYRIQEKALGGLKPSTRRLLTKVAVDAVGAGVTSMGRRDEAEIRAPRDENEKAHRYCLATVEQNLLRSAPGRALL